MSILNFTIKLGSKQDELFKLITDYENLPTFLPDQLRSVKILEKEDNHTITEETLVFTSIIKKTITQKTKHSIISDNSLESNVLSGPAKNSRILIKLEENDGMTKIDVNIELNLDFKTKIFSPLIKKWYKSVLTGIFYKMNTEIINSDD